MSDLTATNCGSCSSNFGGGCNSIIWILILFFFCGNNNCSNGCGFGNILGGSNCGCDDGCGNNNNSCSWIIWIILLSCICGGNNGCNC
ncbi:MAG: chorion class high-cysteine HCB protein 13 [Lachnospiraceae bacterium]|nr:chorion class high-cysteine HCB protein 13 [Lachnospiraceae bacterium]